MSFILYYLQCLLCCIALYGIEIYRLSYMIFEFVTVCCYGLYYVVFDYDVLYCVVLYSAIVLYHIVPYYIAL